MSEIITYITLGLAAGTLSGLIGIGGGIIIVPVLVIIMGFSQHLAQGTTLALMVPPIGILAAWTYYKNGYVDLKVALLICIGFFIGGLCGAKIATAIPSLALEKIFGVALLVVAVKMIFFK
ncbi:MAG: sulfite exporter TauE/SafE family protein [Candidatus Melainabacteria bacterium]|nr:sulfite exporter TauE/SafE family protein [Candidatus Melainabacteria bacterium]MBI3307798.1 sulfite exporter TauE/SafE family protein [Candidatus Melainabacteria bacterium]